MRLLHILAALALLTLPAKADGEMLGGVFCNTPAQVQQMFALAVKAENGAQVLEVMNKGHEEPICSRVQLVGTKGKPVATINVDGTLLDITPVLVTHIYIFPLGMVEVETRVWFGGFPSERRET